MINVLKKSRKINNYDCQITFGSFLVSFLLTKVLIKKTIHFALVQNIRNELENGVFSRIFLDKMYAYFKQKRCFSIRILQFHKCFF